MERKTILFTEVQNRLIKEVLDKNQRELNSVFVLIYKELGILEEVKATGQWRLLPKFAGVEKIEMAPMDVGKLELVSDIGTKPEEQMEEKPEKDPV